MAMSAKTIVLNWLNSLENKEVFFTYNFEELVPVYGRIKYDRYHTASTYSRAFRELRSSNVLDDLGFKLTEVKHKNNRTKGWRIEHTTSN